MTPTEKAVEAMAAMIDPPVFDESGPVPTREDTINWHERRKAAYAIAGRIISLHPGIAGVIAGTGVVVEISTLREVERLSRSSCLVPPDGGEPTEQEAHISNVCGNLIREMADRAVLAAAEKPHD